ncbi:hypothetical protein OC713_02425, partial [Sweet potato little leaf phytoplasma]|uniref:hypothetical protein n=1 Tax=Candidatus Phytoplasma australasiaticum TaxID=2754999 RepID=UPI00271425E8
LLDIPTIKDRLMQKCLEQFLTPYFENIFSEWSFGFRRSHSLPVLHIFSLVRSFVDPIRST